MDAMAGHDSGRCRTLALIHELMRLHPLLTLARAEQIIIGVLSSPAALYHGEEGVWRLSLSLTPKQRAPDED